MRPLPEKWHGLSDVETRHRQRYLDLITNEEAKRNFQARSRIVSAIRRFMDARGFMEVETPVLVPVAAGAMAQPFATHHNALDRDLFLRIATELYLKRLIVGGLDKVYEIGRVFRNEGIDQDHNPEFTLLESYEAYADYNDVMCMVEEMVCAVAQEVMGSPQIQYGETTIDFTPPWKRVSLREEVHRRAGIDFQDYPDADALERKIRELGIVGGGPEQPRQAHRQAGVGLRGAAANPADLPAGLPHGHVAPGQAEGRRPHYGGAVRGLRGGHGDCQRLQ